MELRGRTYVVVKRYRLGRKMRLITDWPLMAACRNGDPDALFVQGAAQRIARRVCQGCAVRNECLVEALDGRIESGVWGGLTESERRALLRRYPHVSSWRSLFQAAQPEPNTNVLTIVIGPSAEPSCAGRSGAGRSGAGRSGAEPSGAEPSGAERSGAERSGQASGTTRVTGRQGS